MSLTVTINQANAARRLGSPVVHLVTELGSAVPLVYTAEQFSITGNGWVWDETERPGRKPVLARRTQQLKQLGFTHSIVHSDYGPAGWRVDTLRMLHESGVKVRMVGGSTQEAECWWVVASLSVVVEERHPDQTPRRAKLTWAFKEHPIDTRPQIARTPPPAPPAPAPVQAAAITGQPPAAGSSYTVKAGDSLWAIAGRLLGSNGRWKEISTLNGLSNPNRISPGQVLKIPAR